MRAQVTYRPPLPSERDRALEYDLARAGEPPSSDIDSIEIIASVDAPRSVGVERQSTAEERAHRGQIGHQLSIESERSRAPRRSGPVEKLDLVAGGPRQGAFRPGRERRRRAGQLDFERTQAVATRAQVEPQRPFPRHPGGGEIDRLEPIGLRFDPPGGVADEAAAGGDEQRQVPGDSASRLSWVFNANGSASPTRIGSSSPLQTVPGAARRRRPCRPRACAPSSPEREEIDGARRSRGDARARPARSELPPYRRRSRFRPPPPRPPPESVSERENTFLAEVSGALPRQAAVGYFSAADRAVRLVLDAAPPDVLRPDPPTKRTPLERGHRSSALFLLLGFARRQPSQASAARAPPLSGLVAPSAIAVALALVGFLLALWASRRARGRRGLAKVGLFLNGVVLGLAGLAVLAIILILS
jgi:hypothetical protein